MKLLLLLSLSCVILRSSSSNFHQYSSLGGRDLGSYGHGDSDLNLQQKLHDNYGHSHHGLHDDHDETSHGHKSYHSIGSQGSQSAHGGNDGHIKKYHDKGSYLKEKKYGYEKAYGYEKESKYHDKGGNAHSYGDSYHHHTHHNKHKHGSAAGGAHAFHKKKHHYGGQNYGQHGKFLDKYQQIKNNHGQWSKYRPKYYSLDNLGGHHRSSYMTPFGGFRYRSFNHLKEFPKWKYIGGLMNIGGYRKYSLHPFEHGLELDHFDDGLDHFDDGLDLGSELDSDPEIKELITKAKSLHEPVGLSGLGGGLGQHGHHYYYSKHYSS